MYDDRTREYQAEYRERNKDRLKAYRDSRKEVRTAAAIRWQKAHPEELKASQRRYYQNNKEKRLAHVATWREKNKESLKLSKAKYHERTKHLHKERVSKYSAYWVLHKYGLTQEAFDALLASQGGGCAICGGDPGIKSGRFRVDHCHDSGEVRGLLCHPCNVILGLVKEDPRRLLKAAEYLTAHYHLKLKALIG